MNINDEIDIVKKDGNGRINPRRVRLLVAKRQSHYYLVTGCNMQGRHPIEYRLPLEEAASVDAIPPDSIGWLPCPPVTTIDD